jgi:NADP-dependent 3-hydroxy acid dehydrogenase YdfG
MVSSGPGRDLARFFRLDGKVALVTGGSYGLGVLFAQVLAEAEAPMSS